MAMLEIILGMMFTYMVLSLLGTTVNELISSWRGWRGFYLEEALKRLLKSKEDADVKIDGKTVFEKFTDNEFYKQLKQHEAPLRVSTAPDWLSSSNFVSILVNTLKKSDTVIEKVDEMIDGLPKDSKLRAILEQFKSDGHEDVASFKTRLQTWFDDVMSHSSGWYRRHLQFVTFFVGLAIAIVVNADSFDIYSTLTNNVTARQSMASLAETFAANNATLPMPTSPSDSLSLQEIRTELRNFTNSEDFSQISNILGLGWSSGDLMVSPKAWLIRLLGWIITALAISMGAPFWFSALKKVLSIRSSSSTTEAAPQQVIINTGENQNTAV